MKEKVSKIIYPGVFLLLVNILPVICSLFILYLISILDISKDYSTIGILIIFPTLLIISIKYLIRIFDKSWSIDSIFLKKVQTLFFIVVFLACVVLLFSVDLFSVIKELSNKSLNIMAVHFTLKYYIFKKKHNDKH